MECKGNVTALVTINMPRAEGLPPDRLRFSKPQVSHHPRFDHKKALAIGLHLGVVQFTYELPSPLPQTLLPQTPSSSPKRNTQCPSCPGPRPDVSGNQLLRPAGSAPGQVRDAAPRAARRPADQLGG